MAEELDPIKQKIEIEVNETGTEKATASINDLSKSTDDFTKAQSKSTDTLKKGKEAIGEIAPATTGAVQGLLSMGKAMWALVANPLGAVITAIAVAVGVLFAAFKTFQPLLDKVEQTFNALGSVIDVVKGTITDLVTGAKSLGDAFSGLGSDMNKAYDKTVKLTKAQQDLDDALASQEVTTARNRAQINRLNVELKNRTKSDQERLAIADKIAQKENEDFLQRKRLVDEEVRLARKAIAIKARFSKEEQDQLKRTGDATKELAESRGGNYDKEFEALNKARLKAIALEDEVTVNLERTQSRRDSIEDAAKAKIEAAQTKAKEQAQKQAEEAKKRTEEQKKAAEKAKKEADDLAKSEFDAKKETDKQLRDLDAENAKQKEEFQKEKDEAALQAMKDFADREVQIEKDKAQQKKDIQDSQLRAADSFVNFLKTIAGKNKLLQKAAIIAESALGIGKSIISNNVANAGALATPQAIATSGAAAAPVIAFNNVSTGLGIAANIAATAKALSSLGGGGGSGGGATGGGATPTRNVAQVGFQGSSENQISSAISKQAQNQKPIEAFVVSQSLTDSQELQRKKELNNSF